MDAAVLAEPPQLGQSVLEEGPHVPAGTSRRLACDASRVVMRHDRTGGWWKSGPERGRSRRRCGGRSSIGTRPAASRAVTSGSPRGITCGTGRTAGRRSCRTSRCSAAGITARCTRRATRSSDYPTETAVSAAGWPALPDVPPPPGVPADPAGAIRRRTPRRGSPSMRARDLPGGRERLDVGRAIDVLHPLAARVRSTRVATGAWLGRARRLRPRSRSRPGAGSGR